MLQPNNTTVCRPRIHGRLRYGCVQIARLLLLAISTLWRHNGCGNWTAAAAAVFCTFHTTAECSSSSLTQKLSLRLSSSDICIRVVGYPRRRLWCSHLSTVIPTESAPVTTNPQTKPIQLGCKYARRLFHISTIAIYYLLLRHWGSTAIKKAYKTHKNHRPTQ